MLILAPPSRGGYTTGTRTYVRTYYQFNTRCGPGAQLVRAGCTRVHDQSAAGEMHPRWDRARARRKSSRSRQSSPGRKARARSLPVTALCIVWIDQQAGGRVSLGHAVMAFCSITYFYQSDYFRIPTASCHLALNKCCVDV